MTPVPARHTRAGTAYNDLRNLARRHGRDPAEYFALYALEGFLARLAASPAGQDFVLKGGVLMAAFAARRPTRDIDLAASGFPNGIPEVEQRIRKVIGSEVDDGLTFDPQYVAGSAIRDEADYRGVRVKLVAQLVTARIPLHVDVNFGDPIWPAPAEAELPLLLGGTLRLRGYPDHMVLAEKIVTAIERGELNTRWRDFVDIAAISRTRRITYEDQRAAVDAVAAYRLIPVTSLMPLLDSIPAHAERKWQVWRRKQHLESTTAGQFAVLLGECLTFAEPVLDRSAAGATWNPVSRSWERPPQRG